MPPATAASNRKAAPLSRALGLQFRPVVGDHVLVRRDDRLAGAQGRRYERPRRLVAADELDDDVGVGIRDEVGRSVGQKVPGQAIAPAPDDIADRDGDHGEWGPIGGDDPVRVMQQRLEHGTADGPRAEHGDAQRRTAQRSGS